MVGRTRAIPYYISVNKTNMGALIIGSVLIVLMFAFVIELNNRLK